MNRITPQQQVWKYLRTDDQRAILAQNFRHIKRRTQEDICYGLLAFLRWGIIRPFEDKWVNKLFQALLIYLKTERSLGKL
ncbi:MAG: hypothetical protein Q4E68_08750 [Prevotellaceae bacterium]|nr:hypothetical protein [Prevotellaceae bacterium]